MIEGLKVLVKPSELRLLCENRAAHHESRVEFYSSQLSTLESLDQANSSMQPGEQAKRKIESHRVEAGELRFIATHLDDSETYTLSQSDLCKLGIGARAW